MRLAKIIVVPGFFCGVLLSSCAPISPSDQAVLSRPVMATGASGARAIACGLTTQIESGRVGSSAMASGGCSSCH